MRREFHRERWIHVFHVSIHFMCIDYRGPHGAQGRGHLGQGADQLQATITHTYTYITDNLKMLISQQCMSLDWENKAECPEAQREPLHLYVQSGYIDTGPLGHGLRIPAV